MQLCCKVGNHKCVGFHKGECYSIENCMWQSDGKLRNGMWNYDLVKPTENKPYLVMFQGAYEENVWFEVVNYQAKVQRWKRLSHMVVGWSELPSKEYEKSY